MKHISATLIIVLLAIQIPVQCADSLENKSPQVLNQKGIMGSILSAIATSDLMHRYNQFFAKAFPLEGVCASQEVQTLAKEAQTALGIPADRQVPIQYVADLDASAIARPNAIFVGRELVNDKVVYGIKRCNMFHEAVHIKYHDYTFNSVFYFGSLLGVPLANKLLINPQGKLKLVYLPMLVAGHYLGRAMQRKFEKYRERRADIEGHYATQCHQCVTEKAEDIRKTYELAHDVISYCDQLADLNEGQINGLAWAKGWIEDKKPYLSVEENQIIADELKRDNKICAFHEQSK